MCVFAVQYNVAHKEDHNMEVYSGETELDVYSQYVTNKFSVTNLLPFDKKSICLAPFTQSCVGVKTSAPYSIKLAIIGIDLSLGDHFCR